MIEDDSQCQSRTCIHFGSISNFVQDFEEKQKQGQISPTENTTLCVHVDSFPRCSLTNAIIINNPVLGSDGRLYNKNAILRMLKENSGRSIVTGKLFPQIFDGEVYISIQIACQDLIYSKIDPRRVLCSRAEKTVNIDGKTLLSNEGLVFVGEAAAKDTAVIFVEQRVKCEQDGVSFFHGKINTYQFGKNGLLDSRSFTGTKYSALTQASLLLDTFQIDPRQVDCRSFGCTKHQITMLKSRIIQDIQAASRGELIYSPWAEKMLPTLWARFTKKAVYHTSCSWARDVLRDEGVSILKKNKNIQFEQDFPYANENDSNNPYQPICISSSLDILFGVSQKRIFPTDSIVKNISK